MIPVAGLGGHPLVLAHRGGGDEAPENSLDAVAHMRSLGIRHFETDAHATADGVVVLHHDDTVDDAPDTRGGGTISELTWDQIRGMPTASGQPMPLLGEVLEAAPDLYLNIDAKTDDVVDPLLDVLSDHDAVDRVLIASFSEPRLERIRARVPADRLTTSLGVSAVARLAAAAQTGTHPDSWRVPGPRRGVRAVQVPQTYRRMPVVTARFVATAHAYGLAVHVWTVNDAADMARLLDMGVDGLITDRPTLARELLRARGQWREPPSPCAPMGRRGRDGPDDRDAHRS